MNKELWARLQPDSRVGLKPDPHNPIGEYVGAGVVYRSAAAEGWRRQFGVAVGVAELGAR